MLSVGQINDAYQEALGRPPTGDETQAALSSGLDGDPGKQQLISAIIYNYKGEDAYNQYQTEQALNQVRKSVDVVANQYIEADQRNKKFNETNPFTFDEAQAKASATERFDPYYNAELGDFTTGVQNQIQRGTQDVARVAKELTADLSTFVGRTKENVLNALDAAKQGFAGSGLYASGARLRNEGQIGVQGQRSVQDQTLSTNRTLEGNRRSLTRNIEDLNLQQNTFNRRLNAEKTTNILTDVEKQRQDASRQHEFERQQYVGYPLTGGSQSLSSIFRV